VFRHEYACSRRCRIGIDPCRDHHSGQCSRGRQDAARQGEGDAGYIRAGKRAPKRERRWLVATKHSEVKAIEDKQLRDPAPQIEHLKASIRAPIEHPFRVINRQFDYRKARFNGLTKNTTQTQMLFALAILWMAQSTLLTAGEVHRNRRNPRNMHESRLKAANITRRSDQLPCAERRPLRNKWTATSSQLVQTFLSCGTLCPDNRRSH
jgi:hypothetical protein